jgi:AAA+ ATPase superfamily predicted ATPase
MFYNRDGDKEKIKRILSGEPNLVYFMYGPINSGKTALLMRVFEEIGDEYVVFYINFRGVETMRYEDFVRAMFTVRYDSIWEKIRRVGDVILAGISYVEEVMRKFNYTIPIPREIFKEVVSGSGKEGIDCFKYLEGMMRGLVERGKRLVFVLDELQMLRGIRRDGEVLRELFNFLVRVTKEGHLSHVICATSDCLFVEEVYNNARLEGRSRYILVDDLDKESAYEMYDRFRFRDKDVVWGYIGGKIGDMVRLYEWRKEGIGECEALEEMLLSERRRIEDIIEVVRYGKEEYEYRGERYEIVYEGVKRVLEVFSERYEVSRFEIEPIYRDYLVNKNVLFYEPIRGVVKPQGGLIRKAIGDVVKYM